MRVLVAGGAGYIGSHVTLALVRAGYVPIVVDNFSNSRRSVINRLKLISGSDIKCRDVDLTNLADVVRVFQEEVPAAVIHLAGLKSVAQSTAYPLNYYISNLSITFNILSAMTCIDCGEIIFSSSATIYGEPRYLPIDEEHKASPLNPYGRTKLYQEGIIQDWADSNSRASAIFLRYFNPVGADASSLIGDAPTGAPNNLLPILGDVAMGVRSEVTVFGCDYPTRDGTCERDYIHVSDLAQAHVAALQCQKLHGTEVFNVGTGRGVTVREAIDTYSKILGRPLAERLGERRTGDAAASIAANSKIITRLDWRPQLGFEDACRDDFNWRNKLDDLIDV